MELGQLGRVSLAFVFVIALMLLIAWLARRLKLDERLQGLGRAKGNITIEESFFIDPKRRLLAFTDGESRYLLLLGPNGDTLLSKRSRLPGEAHDEAV